MKKLTKEDIKKIIPSNPIAVSEEDLKAIFKLFGLQIKEYREGKDQGINKSTCFEIHHKREFIIEADVDRSKTISYGNEWVNWGEAGSGVAIPTPTVGNLILTVINFFIDKLHVRHDGPEYSER